MLAMEDKIILNSQVLVVLLEEIIDPFQRMTNSKNKAETECEGQHRETVVL